MSERTLGEVITSEGL